MEIRPVAEHEHARVGALTVAAYESVPGLPLDGYRETLCDVGGRVADAVVLVAVEDEEVRGAVTYVPGPDSASAEFTDPAAAGMRFLAVDPEVQGRGVGAALTRACLARARHDGRERLVLHSTAWMVTAVRLYERLGFRRAVELDWTPEPGVTLLGYAYEL
ncbi:MAG: GNAT family N-acetyltransferase [Egibacteraceae bacterium]